MIGSTYARPVKIDTETGIAPAVEAATIENTAACPTSHGTMTLATFRPSARAKLIRERPTRVTTAIRRTRLPHVASCLRDSNQARPTVTGMTITAAATMFSAIGFTKWVEPVTYNGTPTAAVTAAHPSAQPLSMTNAAIRAPGSRVIGPGVSSTETSGLEKGPGRSVAGCAARGVAGRLVMARSITRTV